MKSITPGGSYFEFFTTRDETGAAVNADSLPTVSVYIDGILSAPAAALLTVTNMATGLYKVTGTLSAPFSLSNQVAIVVSATVVGVVYTALLESIKVDNPISQIVAQIGSSFTGIGVNTIWAYLVAIMSKDASVPGGGVIGTYDPAVDSMEALSGRTVEIHSDVNDIQANVLDLTFDATTSKPDIVVYKGTTAPNPTIAVTDDDDDPVDCSSFTLKLVVYNPQTNVEVFSMTEATGLSVGGAANNKIAIDVDATDLATPGSFKYELWRDDTEKQVLATGAFVITNTKGVA